jgi:hypothetical protein
MLRRSGDETAKDFGEPGLAALVTHIAAIHTWSLLNSPPISFASRRVR